MFGHLLNIGVALHTRVRLVTKGAL